MLKLLLYIYLGQFSYNLWTLLERTGLEMEQFRIILTQDYCSCIDREGYHGDGNTYLLSQTFKQNLGHFDPWL